ncbi:MAG: FAD-dependent oxidoreductase [Oligoflexia bacterium]|nr:FAD-dependent oxidoreductase [Oligoflexia bacterium]
MMDTEQVDLVVVGGGISGLGVLLEASLNAFSAVLLEKGKICQATSANSLRIIHGGLRYLQTMDLPRIRESVEAQAELLEDFPGAIEKIRFLAPLSGQGLKKGPLVRVAAGLYRAYVGKILKRRAEVSVLSSAETAEIAPFLDAPFGSLWWQDGLMLDPYEIVEAVRAKAVACGARVAEECRVTSVDRVEAGFVVRYRCDGREHQVRARTVVNASGPWLFLVGKDARDSKRIPSVTYCRAFNVIVNRALKESLAIGVENSAGRYLFAVPRAQYAALGTGYLEFSGSADQAHVSDDEVQAFLREFQQVLPAIDCTLEDVVKVEVGILPMRPDKNGIPQLIGAEEVYDHEGFVDLLSTKYTTFRTQARRAISLIRPYITRAK